MQTLFQNIAAWISEVVVGTLSQPARVMKHRTGSEMITSWTFAALIISATWLVVTDLQMTYSDSHYDDAINVHREHEAELRVMMSLERFKAEFPEADLPDWTEL